MFPKVALARVFAFTDSANDPDTFCVLKLAVMLAVPETAPGAAEPDAGIKSPLTAPEYVADPVLPATVAEGVIAPNTTKPGKRVARAALGHRDRPVPFPPGGVGIAGIDMGGRGDRPGARLASRRGYGSIIHDWQACRRRERQAETRATCNRSLSYAENQSPRLTTANRHRVSVLRSVRSECRSRCYSLAALLRDGAPQTAAEAAAGSFPRPGFARDASSAKASRAGTKLLKTESRAR